MRWWAKNTVRPLYSHQTSTITRCMLSSALQGGDGSMLIIVWTGTGMRLSSNLGTQSSPGSRIAATSLRTQR